MRAPGQTRTLTSAHGHAPTAAVGSGEPPVLIFTTGCGFSSVAEPRAAASLRRGLGAAPGLPQRLLLRPASGAAVFQSVPVSAAATVETPSAAHAAPASAAARMAGAGAALDASAALVSTAEASRSSFSPPLPWQPAAQALSSTGRFAAATAKLCQLWCRAPPPREQRPLAHVYVSVCRRHCRSRYRAPRLLEHTSVVAPPICR